MGLSAGPSQQGFRNRDREPGQGFAVRRVSGRPDSGSVLLQGNLDLREVAFEAGRDVTRDLEHRRFREELRLDELRSLGEGRRAGRLTEKEPVMHSPERAGRLPAELARRRHLRDGALLALRSELLGNRREGGADPNRPAVFSRYLKLVTRPLAMSTEVAHVGEPVVDRGAHRDALLPPFHSTLPLLVFTSARSSHQVLAP